ncbi:hypothetical protein GCM10010289_70130 [Streptomyces violascens]|nr:hypothetical protein GCM10010289_70130 [Streptomyces violascens]
MKLCKGEVHGCHGAVAPVLAWECGQCSVWGGLCLCRLIRRVPGGYPPSCEQTGMIPVADLETDLA